MAGIAILRRLLLKDAVKKSAPHSGIMSIGPDVRKMVDRQVNKWIDSARRQGQDIDKMGEQEIKYIVEMNKPKAPKVYSNEEAYGILNRFMNQNQKGQVIKGKFGKPFAEEIVTVDSVITDIKKLEPIESMKETNKVLRGEGRYKSLSKADREKIVGDESVTDHIFERNIEPDPEDFAQGGRTGLSYLLAEDTNERMPMWMGGGLSKGKGLLRKLLEHYSKKSKIGAKPTDLLTIINPKQFNEILNRPEGIPALAKDMIKDYTKKVKKDRAGTIEELISSAKNIKKADDAIIAHEKWMIEDMVKKGIDRENAEMFAEGLSKAMAKAGPQDAPKITEQGLLELENIYKNLITKDRPLNAEGGRIGFSKGKGVDLLRRGFLKTMGGAAAGIGALKAGALKLFGKEGATVAKEVTQVPIKNIEGMPSWFKPLVNKVIREGEDMTKQFATKEREIVHATKIGVDDHVRVTQSLDDGTVRVEYDTVHSPGEYGVDLIYKKGEEIPTKKGSVKTKDEFSAAEAEPQYTGGPEDADIEWSGENLVNNVDDLLTDTTKLETYATGKKPNIKKLLKSEQKQKKTQQLNESNAEQANFIEEKYGPGPDPSDLVDDYASGGIAKMLGE